MISSVMWKKTEDPEAIVARRLERKQQKEARQVAKQKPAEGKCNFFLQQKSRYCKFPQVPGSRFCVCHDVTSPGSAVPDNGAGVSTATSRVSVGTATTGTTGTPDIFEVGGVEGLATEDADLHGSVVTCIPAGDLVQGDADISEKQQRKARNAGSKFRKRIPCPLDPSHSIYEDQLQKHLTKCSKHAQNVFVEAQPCYKAKCNLRPAIPMSPAWDYDAKINVAELTVRYQTAVDVLLSQKKMETTDKKLAVANTPVVVDRAGDDPPDRGGDLHQIDAPAEEVNGERDEEHAGGRAAARNAEKTDLKIWAPIIHAAFDAACGMMAWLSAGDAEKVIQGTSFLQESCSWHDDRPTKKRRSGEAVQLVPSGSTEVEMRASEDEDAFGSVLRYASDQISRLENLGNKHNLQNRSLVDAFLRKGLVPDPDEHGRGVTYYLEYGSGKAALSRWLALAQTKLHGLARAHFFAIEREARRNKAENKLEQKIGRLRLDIADFDLVGLLQRGKAAGASDEKDGMEVEDDARRNRLAAMPSNQRAQLEDIETQMRSLQPCASVVVHAKHLCGGATDLTLTSLECLCCAPVGEESNAPRASRPGIKIGIATCCHHRCDTITYVGAEFLQKVVEKIAGSCTPATDDHEERTSSRMQKVTVRELFQSLLPITSWATSGLDCEEKRALGTKAKRLLDFGRMWYCREKLGLAQTCGLNYTTKEISPENFVLLATEKE
eukprot:g4966.t1